LLPLGTITAVSYRLPIGILHFEEIPIAPQVKEMGHERVWCFVWHTINELEQDVAEQHNIINKTDKKNVCVQGQQTTFATTTVWQPFWLISNRRRYDVCSPLLSPKHKLCDDE
jgi:hypothetical protein